MTDQPAASPAMLQRWVGFIGAVVAPTTIITALCYYFGYVYTRKKLAHFGVDCDALGFASSDYVVGSVSVLYAPLLLLLVGWFSAAWVGTYAGRFIRSGQRPRLVRNTGRTILTLGAVFITTGITGVVVPWLTPKSPVISWAFSPTTLGLGGLLIVVGYWVLSTSMTEQGTHRATPTTRVNQTIAIAVSLLALFAVMNSFATRLGDNAAQTSAHELWTRESVVSVVTDERLDVPRNLIAETLVEAQPQQPPRFRYQCFRVLVARGDLWVLVPAKWSQDNGFAVIVPADNSIVSVSRSSAFKKVAEDNPQPQDVPWQCPERAPAPH
ncbi:MULTISPECIES: hypothetical protein [Nocardia]|jgi:hypothetical protein|uniref:hypothetical protein n=1 Tax=Nocardia abscessus TaxID=120957 RepID=UPI001893A1E3|nr:hypothetical protein [Nocardia abscessus]MBF6471780.1 hypothetical protein [Nocardia abscessus]